MRTLIPKENIDYFLKSKKMRFGASFEKYDVLDLSRNNFSKFPDFLIDFLTSLQMRNFHSDYTGYIDLSNNRITEIPQGLDLSNVIGLDLSHNNIHRLSKNANIPKLELLDLSFNSLTKVPVNFLNSAYNLVDLNLNNNNIDSVKTSDIKVLLETPYLTIENNLFGFSFQDKANSALRIGILDLNDIIKSKFKFRVVDFDKASEHKQICENPKIDNNRKLYKKCFEIVSFARFEYEETHPINYEIIQADGPTFWNNFRNKLVKFRDVHIAHCRLDNYFLLFLSNINRRLEFEKFIRNLFGNSLL